MCGDTLLSPLHPSLRLSPGAAAVSGGGGYGRLGGIQQYVASLRELVMLPLQMPQLFAR